MPHYISKEGQLGSLSAAITAGQTTLPINASEISRFDTVPSGSFRWGVIIDRAESGYARFEFFKEVGPSPSGNNLNVVRGQLGTTALAFPIGAGSPSQVQVRISDSIANLMAMVDGFGAIIQATAPTLTAFSPRNVILNPAVPITVPLPTTDVWAGKAFSFINLGTATITINASGGGKVVDLPAGRNISLIANQDTPTAAGHWSVPASLLQDPMLAGTVTGTYTLGGAPTISSPAINSATLDGVAVKANGFDLFGAIYRNVSLDVSSENTGPQGIAFSGDGTKMYMVGLTAPASVYQYTLTTAWDISTASYASKSVSVATEDTNPNDVFFSSDGTKMYVVGNTSDSVYQYTLSTPWDVSTASYASKSLSVATEDTSVLGIAFSGDGTKMYAVGDVSNTIYQYTLTTAWDISTASYASKSVSVATEDTTPRSVVFSSDGTTMLMMGSSSTRVHAYKLSTAWDVSTATYTSETFAITALTSTAVAARFKNDGAKLYVLESGASDKVHEYHSLALRAA